MMNSSLTEDTKAVILLCSALGKDRSVKPLTQTQYTSLVRWLINVKMRPGDLLKEEENIAKASKGADIDQQRLEALLGRGGKLGFAVEGWQRNGIWVISRSDEYYPVRLKEHLKDKSPPLLFGVGDRSLLAGGGMGIVGSRNVDEEGKEFTSHVAELCAYNQMPVVSGGARGVDQVAMATVFEAGGVTIGILAEKLLDTSVEYSARHAIAEGRLLLVSPYHPDAHFTVGTAMGRNKLIYAMSDFCLVVSSEYKKGGTWAGAEEELKRETPRPVFVRTGNKAPQANSKLLDLGAISWPESVDRSNLKQQLMELAPQPDKKEIEAATTEKRQAVKEPAQVPAAKTEPKVPKDMTIYQAVLPIILNALDTMDEKEIAKKLEIGKGQLDVWLKKAEKVVGKKKPAKQSKPKGKLPLFDFPEEKEAAKESVQIPTKSELKAYQGMTIYQAVLPVILNALDTPMNGKDLAEKLEVGKGQLNTWLKKAMEEKKVIKLKKTPVRYQRA